LITFGGFYEDFFASEVGHYVLFVKLGCELVGKEATMARLETFRAEEAKLIASMPSAPRIHSGIAAFNSSGGPTGRDPGAGPEGRGSAPQG